MVNYAQKFNVSPMNTPAVLPDVPTIHSGEPSWGDIAGTALEGAGAIMQQVGGIKKEQEKASAEAAETLEGNNYARDMQRLVARREQTGNRTQFEQSVRALNDTYLSRGVLKADKLASIRNSYDEGYLDINEKSRERWAKYDDEAQLKTIQEMQSKYSHLKGKKTSDILRDYNRITNSLDFAIELQNKMNTLDPVKYPEEHSRLKSQRDSFFESNVTGQVLESIAEDLHNNTDMFKDPVKVEQYKQSLVAFLTRQKVALDDASIIAETALSRAGAYSLYDNEKAILGVSKQNMQDVIDYRKTQADYAIGTEYPELVLQSQLIKTMDPETFKAFANTAEGQRTVKALASNFKSAAEGINQYVLDFSDKGQAANIAATLQRTDAPAILKGSSAVSVAQAINVPSIADVPDRDFDAVISNARGVAAFFSNPYTQATKRQLSTSNKPNDNAVAAQMDAEERHAKALSNAGVYLQSATKGGQNLRYIMQRSTIGNNLRVNNKGHLVFVPGSSPIAAVAEGAAEQYENFGSMIDTINRDVQAITGLSGQELVDFYKALGIPELASGERVQNAPAFNWSARSIEGSGRVSTRTTVDNAYMNVEDANTGGYAGLGTDLSNLQRPNEVPADNIERQNQLRAELKAANQAAELRARADELERQTQNLSPAAMKEYGKGNSVAIKRARETADKIEESIKKQSQAEIKADKIEASSRISNSETLAFADIDYSNRYPEAEIWKTVEEGSAADTERENRIGEFDTKLNSNEENHYQFWKQSLPQQLQSEADYDLRGYFKEHGAEDAEGHLTDKYKKPNHPTFSVESKYYKKGMWAGKWDEEGNFRIPLDTPKEKLKQLIEYWRSGAEPETIIMFDNPKAEKEIKNLEDRVTSYNKQLDDERESADVKREIRRELAEIRNKIARLYASIYINTLGE